MNSFDFERNLDYGKSVESMGDSYARKNDYKRAKIYYGDAVKYYDEAAEIAYNEKDLENFRRAKSMAKVASTKEQDMINAINNGKDL